MSPTAPVVATIDLDAIASNLRGLRAKLPSGTAMLAAVKGNAYGHGAVPVSRFLQSQRLVEMLGVATVAEGVQLRDAGIGLPILKLSHCLPDEVALAVGAGLSLTVVDEDTIRAAANAVEDTTVGVHLKLDSGMGRIGAPLGHAPRLARLVRDLPGISLDGIFTHLPVSDVADDGGFTHDQLARFRAAVEAVQAEVGPVPFVHAANSGAILGAEDLDGFTLARPGVSVYGYYPDATTPRSVELTQALRWTTRLLFRKLVTAGTTVGYGRTWTADRDTWVGTLPVGYADGFSRLNSNRGRVLVNGRSVPIVGRICMDQCMVDLGPDSADQVGDEVVLLGGQGEESISTEEMAELMGTITYEVTCLIAPRVERVHRSAAQR